MGLNARQKEAVEHLDGPILVLAGAGTGKTTVLVERVKFLLEQGHSDSSNILATTFTVKATEEMRQRLASQKYQVPEWIGTFHSLCVKIVRAHATKLDIDPNFRLIEGEGQKQICKRLFGQQADEILEQINIWKNNCKKPEDVLSHHQHRQAYIKYQAVLREEQTLDFGDLLLECCYLWANNPDILEAYKQKFKYICIDEFQDTNAVQFLWLQLLTSMQDRPNIFCVGDDDQAIYAWRGSDNKYILNFQQTYPNAKLIKLEENYRSTGKILDAALSVVERNRQRLGKTLHSTKGIGQAVQVRSFVDSVSEGVWLANTLLEEKGTVGVLVRTMWQVAEVNKVLKEKGLVGGAGLKILLLYLRFIKQQKYELFAQMLTLPKKGIGSATVDKFLAICARREEAGETVSYDDIKEIACQVASRSTHRLALDLLFEQLDNWMKYTHDTNYLVNKIWQAYNSESGVPPLYILQLTHKQPCLTDFLERFKLPEVHVLTIHSSKGLEFDSVYLLGWEENVFPHVRSVITNDLESERRLAYVALTRGREKVYITHVMSRYSPRGILRKGPSRFLNEIRV